MVVKESIVSDTLPAYPDSVLIAWREGLNVVTFVHLCRVKSFRKAVSAVMDDLVKRAG